MAKRKRIGKRGGAAGAINLGAKESLVQKGETVEMDSDPSDHLNDRLSTLSSNEKNATPLRDYDFLYALPETIICAEKCIPCAYKVGLFDVALDKDFCSQVPNQRPEQCPRLIESSGKIIESDIVRSNLKVNHSMGYRPGMSVLCVGDGDFTFSLAVARILMFAPASVGGKEIKRISRVIATSYESIETLRRVYRNFDETLKELHELGAVVKFNVDATNLKDTLFSEPEMKDSNIRFDRVCWNFPCSAVEQGQDGQNDEMDHNKELVRKFVANVTPHLYLSGEIHMCHKTKPPYNQWKLEHVVLEGDPDMKYAGRIVLDRAELNPYIPRKALDRKSFPSHDACFFVFEKNAKGEFTPRFPATLDKANTRKEAPKSITKELLLALRSRLMRLSTIKPKPKGSSRYNGRRNKRFKRSN